MPQVGTSQVIRFATFEVDLQAQELRKAGLRLKLSGQPFQVLAILLEQPGTVVTREGLQKRLWPETFVDVDHNLNTAINKIREALGDSSENPRFVETLPRRGYRFIAHVEKDSEPSATSIASKPLRHRLWQRTSWMVCGLMMIFLLFGIAIWRLSRRTTEQPMISGETALLTALPGTHGYPAFSPDGNQVAFIIQGTGIYTTLVGGEKPLQLTSNAGDSSPTWSPDGRYVAFTRYSINPREISICIIPALGGTVHKLYAFSYNPPSSWELVNWSPAGGVLAFTENRRIQLLSVSDSALRPLTSPPDGSYDYAPIFSPDGLKVAFIRGPEADLFVVAAGGGEVKRLTFDRSEMYGPPAWTPDGTEIVFSSSRKGLHNLWRIPSTGGTPLPVTGVMMAMYPSISRGHNLVYLQQLLNDNIWRLSLRNETHPQGAAAPILAAKWENLRPNFNSDGKRIAFESDRSGYSEIWACDSDGANCDQLTSLQGAAGAPRWSPDGHYVAFQFSRPGHSEIYVAAVASGQPRPVATLPVSSAPNWSRDGQWIYFASEDAPGHSDVWKVPAKGGSPVQVTRHGGLLAAESMDGHFLYYSKSDSPGIWRMPLQNGGEETRILDQPEDGFSWVLSGNGKGIYFLSVASAIDGVDPNDLTVTTPVPAKSNVEFLEFVTGKRSLISTLDRWGNMGLAVSPDGKSILFVKNDLAESSIMLVKNFH
jgi:Tol biopolymer transport system component/DNA-binding winged helix-turn-helix (wHTH) protein